MYFQGRVERGAGAEVKERRGERLAAVPQGVARDTLGAGTEAGDGEGTGIQVPYKGIRLLVEN